MFRSLSGNRNLMACEKAFLEEMLEHFKKNNCIVEAFFQKVVANLKLVLLDWKWYKDWNAHVTQHGWKHIQCTYMYHQVYIAIDVESLYLKKLCPCTTRYAMLI